VTDSALEERVDTLEYYMKELSRQSLKTEMELARLSREMREFKGEMKDFKGEMKDFKGEMKDFKDEMGEFKNGVTRFQEESERDRKRMNRQWGQLANRLGTVVEDIVAPNLPRVARKLLGCGKLPELFALRVQRAVGDRRREYDALLACEGVLLVNETKSKLTEPHIDAFRDKLAEVGEIVPEARGRRVVGVLAALYPTPEVVAYATRRGVLVMGMGDETMDVLNPEALSA
jgi:uncharacterized coiled-coil protein SlyX